MARPTIVTYQIIKIEPAPKGRKITVEFKDATGVPWTQSWDIHHADRPISLEEFMLQIKAEIKRPINYFEYLEEAIGVAGKIQLDQ